MGITVVDLTNGDQGSAAYFAEVARALEVIAKYQPRRLDRIRRDLRYIIVVKQPGGSFWPLLRACALSPEMLASSDKEDIALTIVHEATHARIHARGIEYEVVHRARIERLCVDQEISLARLLSGGPERVAQLNSALETPWWTPEDLRNRKGITLERNVPAWLARWLT